MTTNRHTMLCTTACFAYCLRLLHTCPAVSTAMAEVRAEMPAASSAEPHAAALAVPTAATEPVQQSIEIPSEEEQTGDKPAAGIQRRPHLASEDDHTENNAMGVFEDADAGTQGATEGADADVGLSDNDGNGAEKSEAEAASEVGPSEAGLSEESAVKRRVKPLEGSASVQATLDKLEDTPYCTKCSYPIEEILRAKLYGKQSGRPSFICRGCNCVIAMVGKHMDLDLMACKGMSFADLQGTTQG